MSDQTVIREDRLGMWTVTYPDGAEQHFNSEAEAQAAVKQSGVGGDVVLDPYEREAAKEETSG